MIRYILYIFLLSIGAAWTAAAQVRIGGIVTDEQTETPLSGAHVFTEDMAHGAITNAEGRFVLELPALPDAIVVQHLGYAPRVFPVPPEKSESLVIRLAPIVIPLEEVLVSGEDFASNLMEQVIRRKQRMFAEISSLRMVGQTRLLLEGDDRIVHLSDTAFDLLWLYIGQISIMDEEFVLLEARLFPARHVVFPDPTSGWNVRYVQHFREVAGGFWAPVNLDMEGALRAAVDTQHLRTVAFSRRTLLAGHRANIRKNSLHR